MTNNTAPLFSIITITKNNLAGLRRTADSIVMQDSKNYEWIVVDALSSDGTNEYLQTSPPLIHIRENDSGIYDAMNKGMDRARGTYLLFLNAGDALSDMDILSTIARVADAEKPDFIYGDALETNGFYKKAQAISFIDWGMPTHHQAMLYKRSALKNLHYDTSLQIASDYGFTRRFLQTADGAHYIPAALCIFENGGISESHRKKGRREQFMIRRKDGSSLIKNMFVYMTQTISAYLREYFPDRYFAARRSFSSFLTRA